MFFTHFILFLINLFCCSTKHVGLKLTETAKTLFALRQTNKTQIFDK